MKPIIIIFSIILFVCIIIFMSNTKPSLYYAAAPVVKPVGVLPRCPPGQIRVGALCRPGCPGNQRLVNGVCKPVNAAPPAPVKCPAGQTRVNGVCRPTGGGPIRCTGNKILLNGACVNRPNPVRGKCPVGFTVFNGMCRSTAGAAAPAAPNLVRPAPNPWGGAVSAAQQAAQAQQQAEQQAQMIVQAQQGMAPQ